MPVSRTSSENAIPAQRTSIRARIVRQMLALTGVTILTLSSLSFVIARSFLLQQSFRELSLAAASRENALEEALQNDKRQTALLAATVSDLNEIPAFKIISFREQLEQQGASPLGVSLFDREGTLLGNVGEESAQPPKGILGTALTPFIDRWGRWRSYDVFALVHRDGRPLRFVLAVRFDASPLLKQFFESGDASLTPSLAWKRDGQLTAFHHLPQTDELFVHDLGSLDQQVRVGEPLALAVSGEEGVTKLRDHLGQNVLAAYRTLPSLGWGISVKRQTTDALLGVQRLALSLSALGGSLLVFSWLMGFTLATSLTAPITRLTEKVRLLRPKHWQFRRSIHTGDEVEMLDRVSADLASRLERTYEHLEEEVRDRTRKLQEQSALDRAILESIQHGVIAVDAHGIITDVNPAALSLLGFANEGALFGKKGTEVLVLRGHGGKVLTGMHPIEHCLKKHTVFRSHPTIHISFQKQDGTHLPVSLLAAPLLHGKRVFGAVLLFQDITEERQVDYMKSEFITLASHQLRTPLSSLRWYSELLSADETERLSSVQKAYVEEIAASTKRMVNLIDSLLRVARLEGDALTPEKQRIDVAAFLRQTGDELKLLTKEAKIASSLSIPRGRVMVTTDPTLLRIILQNLFSNAVKYSKPGGEIYLSLISRKNHIEISVKDHGVGIPTSEKLRVFQKFFRAKNVRAMDTDGSGLGLYLARTIIENLGGQISFESREGQGTTFTIRLPV